MNFEIKPYSKARETAVRRINSICLPVTYRKRLYDVTDEKVSFVAVAGGKVIAAVLASAATGSLHILTLATKATCRRRGVATALLSACLEAAPTVDAIHLCVQEGNHAAIAFYESRGFFPAERVENYYSPRVTCRTALKMVKKLV